MEIRRQHSICEIRIPDCCRRCRISSIWRIFTHTRPSLPPPLPPHEGPLDASGMGHCDTKVRATGASSRNITARHDVGSVRLESLVVATEEDVVLPADPVDPELLLPPAVAPDADEATDPLDVA